MSEYVWSGAAADNDFGNGNNWTDESTSQPGEPGSGDLAILEATGSITGFGYVGTLDLISAGGALTTQSLGVTATSMVLAGSLTLTNGTAFSVSDNVVAVGTSTIVQKSGSSLNISGSDGTSGDVVTAMTFGQNTSDRVNYTVTGLGTQLDAIDGNIMIGGSGIANVTVSNGGQIETDNDNSDGSGNVDIAGAAGAQGSLTVTGAYSTLELAQTLVVGQMGSGHFTLSGGADAELGQDFTPFFGTQAMIVGDNAGSAGVVTVTGAGTRLGSNVYGIVIVGDAGTGTMTISAGASGNFGELAVGESATGSVVVTGSGTVLELHQAAIIGNNASGTLQILAGAHLAMVGNTSNTLTLGDSTGANGKLVVSGAGSIVSADYQQVQVGYFGSAAATISSGGVITSGAPSSSSSHTAVFIGTESNAVGTVTIENANSAWTANGEFDLGYYGKGTLLVESGGALTTGNYNGVAGFVEGNQAGSSGTTTVTGIGSKITNSGRFIVGNNGTGTLTISTGATVTTTLPTGSTVDGAIIGDLSGSTGKVTVTGTGAKWTIGTDLVIGNAGAGTLTVGAGGTVSAASLTMASTGTGSLTVSGTGADVAVTGNALFGTSAVASVSLGTGGVLSVGGAGEIKDGSIALSGGSLSVSKTLTVDAGQTITGHGTIQATGGLINAGTVQATGGTMSFIGGSITGTGQLEIAAASTLSLGGSVGAGQQAIFQSATSELVLGAPTAFAGTISGFSKGDKIDLSGIVASSLTCSGNTLTVHESGGASFTLKFASPHTLADFGALTSDGHGGTLITHS